MKAPDREDIEFIEWYKDRDGWNPVRVQTETTEYEFQYCRQNHVTLWRDVGGKSPLYPLAKPKPLRGAVWSRNGRFRDADGNTLTPATLKQWGYRVQATARDNPFDDADEGRAEYCTVCESYVDEDDTCRHIHRDECGEFNLGTGASGQINLNETKASVFAILDLIPPDSLKCLWEVLQAPDYDGAQHSDSMLGGNCQFSFRSSAGSIVLGAEPYGRERNFETRIRPGLAWLHSLDKRTPGQKQLTIGWIWSHLANAEKQPLVFVTVGRKRFDEIVSSESELMLNPFVITDKQLDNNAAAKRFREDTFRVALCSRMALTTGTGKNFRMVEFRVADATRISPARWQIVPGFTLAKHGNDSQYPEFELVKQHPTLVVTWCNRRKKRVK